MKSVAKLWSRAVIRLAHSDLGYCRFCTKFNVSKMVRAALYICIACLFWAALELLAKTIPDENSPFQIVWFRYAFHLVFMLVVFGPSYRTNLVRTRSLKLQILRPILMIAMRIFFLLGVKAMPLQNVWAIFWLTPLMVMGLASFILKERVPFIYWIAACAGLSGIFAIFRPADILSTNWTIILPLGMAFCFSLYLVLTRMLHTERSATNLFYTGLVVFLPWSFGLPLFWQHLSMTAIMMMSAVAFFAFWSLFFLDAANKLSPVSKLAPFLYAQPAFLVFLGL